MTRNLQDKITVRFLKNQQILSYYRYNGNATSTYNVNYFYFLTQDHVQF